MAGLSDEDARDLFEQHESEQTSAGLLHIAESVAEFRDALLTHEFSRKEAFKLCREFLIELMANTGPSEDAEE